MALRANPAGFDHGAANSKAVFLGGFRKIDERVAGVELFSAAALFADEKDGRAFAGADIARHERVQAFDAMREAHAHEKIERAIDCRRLCRFVGVDQRQQIIGFGGAVLIEQQFEHPFAQRREALAGFGAAFLGFRDLRGVIVGVSHGLDIAGCGVREKVGSGAREFEIGRAIELYKNK